MTPRAVLRTPMRTALRMIVAISIAAGGIGLVPAHAGAAPAPTNPSDGQITAAQQAKVALAEQVGRLQGLVARANGAIARLSGAAELAGERYLKAQADLLTAQRNATTASNAVTAAQAKVVGARDAVGQFARESYIEGSTMGPTMSLLSASGPSDFIERAGLLESMGAHRLGTVTGYESSTVARANAQSNSRAAVRAMAGAQATAAKAKRSAETKVTAARAQMAALTLQRTQIQGQLVQAQARLSGLTTARQAYLKWKARQEAIARAKAAALAAAKARAARLAAQAAAAAKLAAQVAAAKLAAQRRAEQARVHEGSSGGGSSGGGSVGGGVPPAAGSAGGGSSPAPSAGSGWSASEGRAVVQTAEHWLDTPYAWAGGTASGPSYGAPPDTGVLGFDCSGLALYAWAQQGVYLPHYSGYQYSSGPHPSTNDLLPGDLLFWSNDGTPSTIHHVAIYIGDGKVIEAPSSGDVIKIVPIWYDGLVGATRPGA
ncbi:MAG: hypothetical protein DLM56_11810 [Pseudonocardiales bacterium]|nr:MAG: hypothetical protein DLM56_11810 [Pseudonocardiales bacterium]